MKPYSAARSGSCVFVRAHGLSNMKTAPILDAFLRTEIADGANEVVVDLSECSGMDSTFMGTLVGFAQLMGERGGQLVVINPGENNLRLLETLGVTTVLPVLEATTMRENELVFEPLELDNVQSTGERMRMIARAHENLVRLKEANQAKFAPFLAALHADLDKHESDKVEVDLDQDQPATRPIDPTPTVNRRLPDPERD